MSEQVDAYSAYETALDRLQNRLGRGHPRLSEVLVYKQRLIENITQARQFGDTPILKADRAEIIHQLNKITQSELGISFNELRLTRITRQEPDRHLSHIADPLSLTKPSLEGPVSILLEDVRRNWSQASQEEALSLCHEAMRCAQDFGKQAEVAMAQLYLADVTARSDRFEEAIELARRAIGNFRRAGDYHNQMVAHMLRARLTQALQNISEAIVEYGDALALCQKLESGERETAQSRRETLYSQIAEEIQQALKDVNKGITHQYSQRCFLRYIPVLQPSDKPKAALRSTKMVEHLTIGEFEIEEDRYFLYPLNRTGKYELELKVDAIHFALPVLEDGWFDPISKKEDYALMRYESDNIHEGLGALRTENEWISGRFERDTVGSVHFFPQRPHIIGTPRIERDEVGNFRVFPRPPQLVAAERVEPCKAIALLRRAPKRFL